jgi:hypothetical protein
MSIFKQGQLHTKIRRTKTRVQHRRRMALTQHESRPAGLKKWRIFNYTIITISSLFWLFVVFAQQKLAQRIIVSKLHTLSWRQNEDLPPETDINDQTESDWCQVKLLITNNAFCIVQRATAQSKTGIFRTYGVAEAIPGFQAGWSDCMYFFLSFRSFCLFIWNFRVQGPKNNI